MTDSVDQARAGAAAGEQPKRTRLGRILAERPEARPRLRSAIGSLLAAVLVGVVAIGLLAIWHLRRRAQLIRDRLAPPRSVSLPASPAGPASNLDD